MLMSPRLLASPPLNRGFLRISGLILVAALGLSACSGTPVREPVPQAAPTAEPTRSVVAVATPPPTVAPTPTPSLEDDDLASITTLEAGEQVVDAAGDLLAVHALRRAPQALGDGLAGNADTIAALDVSMCAAGEFAESQAGSIEFQLVADARTRLGSSPAIDLGHAVIAPAFAIPDPGECRRGWLAVSDPAPAAAGDGVDAEVGVGRYVLARLGTSGLERHVYQWQVPDADLSTLQSAAEDAFRIGQVVTFNEGPLVGTTVEFDGWAELIDEPAPDGRRLVGVAVEVCTATEDWPEFGITIDGWNLTGPLDPGDRLGADPLDPLSGKCFADWVEFAVPLGQVPSGFFVSDGVDPVNGFAQWTFEGAAINPPQ